MTEDMNKDLIPKAAPPTGTPQVAKKPATSASSDDSDEMSDEVPPKTVASKPAPKASAPKPAAGKKPGAMGIKPMRDALLSKEDELYPSDEEEEDEDEEDEDSLDSAFDEESDLDDGETTPSAILANTDTSERIILVVDEDGQRRHETVAIISQILPNAVIEVANDPEDALAMMAEGDFDTFVVNFLMPGYSSSPFVKAVANHPEHPLLIGFAADKMSDAVDPKKGLKIIPLKRLFDLDTSTATDTPDSEPPED
jgi:hypothetical protein